MPDRPVQTVFHARLHRSGVLLGSGAVRCQTLNNGHRTKPMTLIRIRPVDRARGVHSTEARDSTDSTQAGVGHRMKDRTNQAFEPARRRSNRPEGGARRARGRIQTLRPRSSARGLVDQFRTLIEEIRWQRADAFILALQDHPLKTTLWAVIDEALASMPADKQAPGGRAAS